MISLPPSSQHRSRYPDVMYSFVDTSTVGPPDKRWLYLSLDSEKVGSTVLPECFRNILGDPIKENWVIRFILDTGIHGLLLYDLHKILVNYQKMKQLSDLLILLRRCGAASIYAVGAIEVDWKRILEFHNFTCGEVLEGMVTEIEFWSDPSGSFGNFAEILKYMRSLSADVRDVPQLKVAAYVGWFADSKQTPALDIARGLCAQTDMIFLHCYSATPLGCCRVAMDRIYTMIEAAKTLDDKVCVKIVPIFSAEGRSFNANGGHYLGDWLMNELLTGRRRPNELAEYEFFHHLKFFFTIPPRLRVEGICYYSYEFLFFALNYSGLFGRPPRLSADILTT